MSMLFRCPISGRQPVLSLVGVSAATRLRPARCGGACGVVWCDVKRGVVPKAHVGTSVTSRSVVVFMCINIAFFLFLVSASRHLLWRVSEVHYTRFMWSVGGVAEKGRGAPLGPSLSGFISRSPCGRELCVAVTHSCWVGLAARGC